MTNGKVSRSRHVLLLIMFSVQAMAGAQSPFSSMDPNRQQQAASYQGESCGTNWRTGSCFKKYLKKCLSNFFDAAKNGESKIIDAMV